jgi:hypothetical protein
MNEETRG